MITRERIQEAIVELTREAWERREELGVIERSDEIQQLVKDQLDDDVYVLRRGPRLGRKRGESQGKPMLSWDLLHKRDRYSPLQRPLSREQLALRVALEPYLLSLDGDERVLLGDFAEGFTLREIGKRLRLSHQTVMRRQQKGFTKLRDALTKRYAPEEVTRDGLDLS